MWDEKETELFRELSEILSFGEPDAHTGKIVLHCHKGRAKKIDVEQRRIPRSERLHDAELWESG